MALRWSLGKGLIESAIAHVLILGGAIISLFMWSWWPLIGAFLVDTMFVSLIIHWRTPLVALRPEDVSRTRRIAIIATIAFVGLVVLAGLSDR